MPPIEQSQFGTIQFLTRLLAANIIEWGGEMRIKNSTLRQLDKGKLEGNAILEDYDSATDEIVLRFGVVPAAVYPVGQEWKKPSPPQSVTAVSQPVSAVSNANVSPVAPSTSPNSPQSSFPLPPQTPSSRLPYTEEQLASAERKLHRLRVLSTMEREKRQAG